MNRGASRVAAALARLGDLAGLAATPLSPWRYVEMVRPLASARRPRARVEAVHDEVPGVRTLTLRPGRGWQPHRAGQHVRIGLAIDGRVATRTYSISSPPGRGDGCIAITVKEQGRVSRALVRDVEVGAFVTIGSPEGEFVADARGPVLFVSGGSGITPIASIVRDFAARRDFPDVVHVHFARTEAEMIFGAELHALALDQPRYRLIAIATARDPRRLDEARLTELVPDWRARETWACGPQALLAAVATTFDAAGRTGALHVERFRAVFAARPPEPRAEASPRRVRFAASGVDAEADPHTPLLQIAERAGLAPPSGCRMGVCHTCDATLMTGCVRDLRSGDPIDEAGARIQICVCAADGDVELDL